MLDHSHLAIPLRGIEISWGFAPPSNPKYKPRTRLPLRGDAIVCRNRGLAAMLTSLEEACRWGDISPFSDIIVKSFAHMLT